MSGVDRELLWKAWPEGYVARRGVSTVQSFVCVGLRDDGYWEWRKAQGGNYILIRDGWDVSRALGTPATSGLLPNVDPSDVATWACLLHDLIEAAGLPTQHLESITWNGYFQMRMGPDAIATRAERLGWKLGGWWDGDRGGRTHSFEGIDTADPAEALVRARIQLREQAS